MIRNNLEACHWEWDKVLGWLRRWVVSGVGSIMIIMAPSGWWLPSLITTRIITQSHTAASFSILNLHIWNITSHFKRNVEIFLTQIVEETPSGLCVAIVYIILHITSGNMSALGLGAHTWTLTNIQHLIDIDNTDFSRILKLSWNS